MKISYAITVCDELSEFRTLVEFIQYRKRPQDELIVLHDVDPKNTLEGSPKASICHYCAGAAGLKYYYDEFDGDFGKWKNLLNDKCIGDYIFQIDADELPSETLIDYLPRILDDNIEVELFWVPRINTVRDLTDEDIRKWHWRVNENGWVNWPDYQGRIYKRKPGIRWEGKVHERIFGAKYFSYLPDSCHLLHPKSIGKQRQQNEFYSKLQGR